MRIGGDIIRNEIDKMRQSSDFPPSLLESTKRAVFLSFLSLLQPLIKQYESKHNESKMDLMAIILSYPEAWLLFSNYLEAACGIGDRQDLGVFHVLSKTEQRPCCYTVQAS